MIPVADLDVRRRAAARPLPQSHPDAASLSPLITAMAFLRGSLHSVTLSEFYDATWFLN